MSQANLFSQEPERKTHDLSEVFVAPKNLKLGRYYASRGGRIFKTLWYVAHTSESGEPVINVRVREGRDGDFTYKDLSVSDFSSLIEQGKLVLIM